MTDYRVHLDIFAGPLDLLLYLVRKEEVDIYDIPIASITEQYIQYLELLKSLDIEVVGDFLVMAATLMEIKSAMLLPRAEPEEMGEESVHDPRAELVRQLLEYKKFKDAANLLEAAATEQNGRQGRPSNLIDKIAPDTQADVDMDQVSIWDLLEAFDTICRATGQHYDISTIQDDTPIDLYQIEVLHRLQSEQHLTFRRIFEGSSNRLVLVGQFLAVLELVRNKLITVEQADDGDLYCRPLTDEAAEVAVQRSIIAVHEEEEAAGSPSAPVSIQEIPPAPTTTPVEAESPAPPTAD